MTNLRKAAEMALEALEGNCTNPVADPEQAQKEDRAIAALRQALAQPERVQFKCTVVDDDHPNGVPLSQWGKQPTLEQTISMTEYKRLQDLVTSQGIRLMEYESAHPKQEPFCYYDGRNIVGKEFADHSDVFPLYTAPPKRKWVGLSDEEMRALKQKSVDDGMSRLVSDFEYIRSIEAKLKEKNT